MKGLLVVALSRLNKPIDIRNEHAQIANQSRAVDCKGAIWLLRLSDELQDKNTSARHHIENDLSPHQLRFSHTSQLTYHPLQVQSVRMQPVRLLYDPVRQTQYRMRYPQAFILIVVKSMNKHFVEEEFVVEFLKIDVEEGYGAWDDIPF